MRISNEKLKEYQISQKVSIIMKTELDAIARGLYGEKLNKYEQKLYGGAYTSKAKRTFYTLYPSEQRTVIATYIKRTNAINRI